MNPSNLLLAGLAASMLMQSDLASAQTVNLQQAVEMSLAADPRIKEREHLVESARALLDEVKARNGWRIDVNAFLGLAPEVQGGFYQGGAYSGTTPRSDGSNIHGLSDWEHLDFALVKPLYTFGKIRNYSEAAKGNIDIKQGDVSLTKAEIVFDTKRAYYGYLTARDIHAFLVDVQSRIGGSVARAQRSLKQEDGEVTQAELYSLQTASGLIAKYVHEAEAVEKISLAGLKVLTGVGMDADLQVADQSIQPVSFPKTDLADLQAKALADRPEMHQLEAGLRAKRALVAASKSDLLPNIYAGVVATANYASRRDRLDNPYVYDPFAATGLTPVIGLKWDADFGVSEAKTTQAQAELDALNYKKQFALAGIPFQVSEAYIHAKANYEAQQELADAATSARRWVIASTADFNAGLEKGDKVAEAFKSYVLAQTAYLQTLNDYNVNVAELARLTGDQR